MNAIYKREKLFSITQQKNVYAEVSMIGMKINFVFHHVYFCELLMNMSWYEVYTYK